MLGPTLALRESYFRLKSIMPGLMVCVSTILTGAVCSPSCQVLTPGTINTTHLHGLSYLVLNKTGHAPIEAEYLLAPTYLSSNTYLPIYL